MSIEKRGPRVEVEGVIGKKGRGLAVILDRAIHFGREHGALNFCPLTAQQIGGLKPGDRVRGQFYCSAGSMTLQVSGLELAA